MLVLQDCPGEPLITALEKGPVAVADCITVAQGIARGLAFIHANNIIHKDINPSNLVYDARTGGVRIIDFGIASSLAYSALKPETADVFEGTLHYIAPEQTGPMNGSTDFRCDFYSLGATLYHLLTGAPPLKRAIRWKWFITTSPPTRFHRLSATPGFQRRCPGS